MAKYELKTSGNLTDSQLRKIKSIANGGKIGDDNFNPDYNAIKNLTAKIYQMVEEHKSLLSQMSPHIKVINNNMTAVHNLPKEEGDIVFNFEMAYKKLMGNSMFFHKG